jgi:hypothetical protein
MCLKSARQIINEYKLRAKAEAPDVHFGISGTTTFPEIYKHG